MDKFLNLPEEKQKTIIDAALKSFGTNGYKKTSASDIAKAAEISKSMIFHYFGTKKALYIYLINYCIKLFVDGIYKNFDSSITDFFDRIRLSTSIEIAVMKKHSAIPAFLTSVYYEKDDEVKEDIQEIFKMGEALRNRFALEGMDTSKFKDNVDLNVLMKMLTWIAEGYTNQISGKTEIDYEVLTKEFDECMNLLRNNFYKEEYL